MLVEIQFTTKKIIDLKKFDHIFYNISRKLTEALKLFFENPNSQYCLNAFAQLL